MSRHTSSWKTFERRCAELFGGLRNPFSGAYPATGTRGDVRHPYLFIEAKYRRRHAVVAWWDAARAKAEIEHKIPLVVLAEHSRHGCWIVLHSGDLERLAHYGETNDLPIFAKG